MLGYLPGRRAAGCQPCKCFILAKLYLASQIQTLKILPILQTNNWGGLCVCGLLLEKCPGFFNFQPSKSAKIVSFLLQEAENILLEVWVVCFFLVSPKIGDFHCSCPLTFSPGGTDRDGVTSPEGSLRISTLNFVTLSQQYHWRPSQSIT